MLVARRIASATGNERMEMGMSENEGRKMIGRVFLITGGESERVS
jgi:hypothetical protein